VGKDIIFQIDIGCNVMFAHARACCIDRVFNTYVHLDIKKEGKKYLRVILREFD